QLGNDTIQGDGSIDITNTDTGHGIGGRVGAGRTAGELWIQSSREAATDGDDYIEGGGGSDVVFGDLGQDDIIGGSSNLYSLTSLSARPDDGDLIFGGAGTQTTRNTYGTSGSTTLNETTYLHGTDSDTIIGDNGDIFRLVSAGAGGTTSYLTFTYDNFTDTTRLLPRAVLLIDYTPGGPDYVPGNFGGPNLDFPGTGATFTDVWGADEVHGESGDDTVYTGGGNDVIYGDAGDDDLIGGWGADWISGGTGDDGILGDDGRIFTSRNGSTEPLNGLNAANVQSVISTPGNIQTATIYPTGVLNKSVDLTPYALNPGSGAGGQADQPLFPSKWANDVIFGGLGNDFIHGGSGDDAISGGEALLTSYASTYQSTTAGLVVNGKVETDWARPFNDGTLLGFDALSGEFVNYDEFDPLRKLTLNADGSLYKGSIPGGLEWFLNFSETAGPLVNGCNQTSSNGTCTGTGFVASDGSDVIFGDYGNDWLVGGTGNDTLWGGWGNDLLNADDNLSTDNTLNDTPDTHTSYEDRAVGGAGLDVLIANTGGDRLIDWVGEFNSFLVPFAPFGMATVSRQVPPALFQFLYDLSKAQGADQTLNQGANSARNGEPFGEIGLVTQKDDAWQDQTGGPRDPQPGNIPGGRRDVLRSATFTNATNAMDGFFVDTGSFTVANGTLQVAATSLGTDAASVFYVDEYMPIYYEIVADISSQKPIAGWNANAFVIFDYFSPTDFKFAGVDVSTNKLVMGHRDATGWHYDIQSPKQLAAGTFYHMLVAVNGTTVTLTVDGTKALTYTFPIRVLSDGSKVGLNKGMVGMGSNNARGSFDNVSVQILPPQVTLDQSSDLTKSSGPFGPAIGGSWAPGTSGYTGTPANGSDAILPVILPGGVRIASTSWLDLTATLATSGLAGIAFDIYNAHNYKFAAIDVPNQRVLLGHYDPRRGLVVDASVATTLAAGTAYVVDVQLAGASASISVGGNFMVSTGYNAGTVDGAFGLLARTPATFSALRVRTNDTQFTAPPPPTVNVGTASVSEGNSGTRTVTIGVTLAAAASAPTSVDWTTSGGTATAGNDYVAANGTLQFAAGETAKTITLTINGDTTYENDETFNVTLSNASGLTMGATTGTVTITNDDPIPTISIGSTSILEGDRGTQAVAVPITLSGPSAMTITVTVTISGGTATAGTDYLAWSPTTQTVTFAPGVTSQTVTVNVIGDKTIEPDETVILSLSA
ncbi:MAG TPA: Calx-beta domain-containing protein, partial [Mycobacteriales bacterium]|nr:Calx-beta domain-containing protein [Mycobacteriales bacterium]